MIPKSTGIAIVMDAERSQHKNKAIAVARLRDVLDLRSRRED